MFVQCWFVASRLWCGRPYTAIRDLAHESTSRTPMTFEPAARLPRRSHGGSIRRTELTDALRGLALLIAPAFSLLGNSALEVVASLAALLSLLFGMSLATHKDRTERRPASFRLLARRMLMESVAYRHLWIRLFNAALVGAAAMTLLKQLMPLAASVFICCLAAFVLLFQRSQWRHMLVKLAPMGRMALVNSLVQILAAVLLFHALEPRLGFLLGVALPFAALPLLQAMLSCRWLARRPRRHVGTAWQGLAAEGRAG